MEESIFHRREVRPELEKYVEVRLHTDVPEDWSRKLNDLKQERIGEDTSPFYEIVDPETGEAISRFAGADLTGERFRAWLERHAG